jgi:tRNA dimethylallyltransferase
MPEKECIIVAGPTAIGKTSFAISLAEKFKTAIISADSRQCYRELNIGVARPSATELARIQHYFVANHSITSNINAASFAREAELYLDELFASHNKVILCGGTGLYIKALVEGLDEIPEIPTSVRAEVIALFESKGLLGIQQALDEIDADFKLKSDFNNPNRVMRALEVSLHTGMPIAQFQLGETRQKAWKEKGYVFRYCIMELSREILYSRINQRVDQMIADGLEEEVRGLNDFKNLPALKTVGYQEFFDYFDGLQTREEAIAKIKQHTRNYAKRQVTWFNKVKSNLTQDAVFRP